MFKNRTLRWCLYLGLSAFLLNGCSTTAIKDGPPRYDVDVSKIPDAVPKREARSKYGNIASYRVFGKYYHTMNSSKNYEERGLASWYGTKFHAQRTSSGEPYDMLSMTAAHKTLPLPTYVQVTNLKNGRQVIVKVNDRGPFAENRIIDLSYVAAKKLGMLGHGTAYVKVKAIDPDEGRHATWAINSKFKQPAVTTQHFGSRVFLQVGAFQNRLYAEKLKNQLAAVVTSPIQITHQKHTSKHIYRVQIGPINDVVTADNITKRLRSLGINSAKKTV